MMMFRAVLIFSAFPTLRPAGAGSSHIHPSPHPPVSFSHSPLMYRSIQPGCLVSTRATHCLLKASGDRSSWRYADACVEMSGRSVNMWKVWEVQHNQVTRGPLQLAVRRCLRSDYQPLGRYGSAAVGQVWKDATHSGDHSRRQCMQMSD